MVWPFRVRAWPLIVRELRVQSRRSRNYWLRTLGALGLIAATAHLLVTPILTGRFWLLRGMMPTTNLGWRDLVAAAIRQFEHHGGVLFGVMNVVLLATIWFVAPLLTADCLSRERREGTLGLLFLTPLRPRDIVLAKLLAHGLRAVGVFLGALPVLILPLLFGGVSWMDAARALLLDAGALMLALAAGLRASSVWNGARSALFGALATATFCAVLWLIAWPVLTTLATHQGSLSELPEALGSSVSRQLFRLLTLAWGALLYPPLLWSLPGTGAVTRVGDLFLPLVMFTVAFILAVLAFVSASRGVARAQTEGHASPLVGRAEQWMGKPRLFLSTLARIRRTLLDRLPVLWVEIRTWRLRLAPWLILLLFAAIEPYWTTMRYVYGNQDFGMLLGLLAGIAGISSASGFQRERSSGILELVLTTPRGAPQLLLGKMASQLLQLTPAIILVVGIEIWLTLKSPTQLDLTGNWMGLVVIGSRISLAIAVGLFFSLRRSTFMAALLWTLVTLALLTIGTRILSWFFLMNWHGLSARRALLDPEYFARGVGAAGLGACVEVVLTVMFLFSLHRTLVRRAFGGLNP